MDKAPHLLGREIPLVLPPRGGSEGPVGFVTGSVDLLYRDPATGELVVVDYKTDALEDEGMAEARARDYAPQLAAYGEAVASAFGEVARRELWFLAADQVVPLR